MSEINPRHFIEELRFDIETADPIKARLVLAHFDEVDSDTRKRALLELSCAPDEFVIPVLISVLATDPELGRTHPALKEVLFSKALDNRDILTQMMLREVKPNHRIVLADIAGEIKLEEATSVLMSILNEEQDERVLRSTIAALGMIGDPSATTPVSEFLYSGSVELIIAAIHAMGQLGTPTALQRLAQKLGADVDLDAMILDVFTGSQEPEALQQLNATLSAHQAYLRNAGKQRLIRIGPKAVPVLIANLRYDDPDLLIHTLNVMGDIADESAVNPIRKLLHNEPKNPNVRFAAYEALGRLPMTQGAFALAQGLHDPVDNVRSAAAGAINANYSTVLAAGIKNMIRDEDSQERPISQTILNAECDAIFLDLIHDAPFAEFAVDFLAHQAHADIRNHYLRLLRAQGEPEIAAAIEGKTGTAKSQALKVFAVDDSKMILNIYRSILHKIGCEPVLFEFPAQAIAAVGTSKPDLIFTDLNMPEISGIELTRAIRAQFTKEALPIVMVTTQNECQDNDAALLAGVNAILNKPFNESMLVAALEANLKRG